MSANDDTRGYLITFEGSEGSGKTTQVERIAERLEKHNFEVLVTREPGGTAIGEEIRHILMHSESGAAMTPEAELLLFAASRAQLVREVIQPAIDSGKVVLCDRFLDSTTVYQGVGRRIASGPVSMINSFAVG
ncbi:MAG TPA: dTMP kinase, partial [Opitutales bacterium]|nr:dTMP kinase [Opitutales bacterium]